MKGATASIQEQLEEAQDTNGYLVRFQDNQMTKIDALKQQIKDFATWSRGIEISEVQERYQKTAFVTRLCVLYSVNVPSLKVIVVTLMHVTVGGRWELKGGSAVHCVNVYFYNNH